MKKIFAIFLLLSSVAAYSQGGKIVVKPGAGDNNGGGGSGSGIGHTHCVKVADYGADNTGANDATAAIAAALSSGKYLHFSAGTYTASGASNTTIFQLADGQGICGDGEEVVTIQTISGARLFALGNNSIVEGVGFKGNGTKTTGNKYQAAIYVNEKIGWQIRNCKFINFGGDNAGGLSGTPGAVHIAKTSDGYSRGGRIESCNFMSNYYGLVLKARAEYVTVANSKFSDNHTSLYVDAGNIIVSECEIQASTFGMKLTGGTNNAHGIVSATTINHNTTNLHINGVTNGHTFTGVMLYSGNIEISGSTGLRFIGCDFSIGTITLTSNTKLLRMGCRVPVAPTASAMTVNLVSGENFINDNNQDF